MNDVYIVVCFVRTFSVYLCENSFLFSFFIFLV